MAKTHGKPLQTHTVLPHNAHRPHNAHAVRIGHPIRVYPHKIPPLCPTTRWCARLSRKASASPHQQGNIAAGLQCFIHRHPGAASAFAFDVAAGASVVLMNVSRF